MAVREDLVSSAVTFLQDPTVANAPLDKRVAFLQSKNLTQEEIDASLARAGDASPVQVPIQPNYGYQQQQMMRPQPPPYGYGQYQGGYWQQPLPEIPRRDWRDYFIMATVMSGLSYGLYFVAKRYIIPIIAPPTPEQLQQDKSAIDASFDRAFSLIDQLTTDTAAIKASEEARKERLDSALSETETAIQDLKTASRRRDDDTRRISDEIRVLQGMIPKAMKAQEESSDTRLKELNAELKSLKVLISNRMASPAAVSPQQPQQQQQKAAVMNGANMFGSYGTASVNGGIGSGTQTPTSEANAVNTSMPPAYNTPVPAPVNQNHNPYARSGQRQGGIPAWQMAAAKKLSETDSAEKKDTDKSRTGADLDGAVDSAAA